MSVAGLFAGIGGFELGFARAGLSTALLCDVSTAAEAVLRHRFPSVPFHNDIQTLRSLPAEISVLAAGFPCQDLSQAGRAAGLAGSRSGLIGEVFRLLGRRRIPTVVIENVPFMLQLGGGYAIRAIVDEFERRRYRWAYRVVDSYGFGVPQRRRRVYIVASTSLDPSEVLLSDDHPIDRPATAVGLRAHGFYWTEGLSGLGWAPDAIPTLKNGSSVGIPSPPAILLPNRTLIKPSIRDAERLQGFDADWTKPAEAVGRASTRWSLVGSAVTVPVAQWIGDRLVAPGRFDSGRNVAFPTSRMAPSAARFDGRKRYGFSIGTDPLGLRPDPLATFLRDAGDPLPLRAAAGFLGRTRRAALRFDPAFIEALERHVVNLGGQVPPKSEPKARRMS